MSLLTSIVLGLIQGVSEFLPISSSGHLAIAEYMLGQTGFGTPPDFFDVLLHMGTLAAVFVAYWADIKAMRKFHPFAVAAEAKGRKIYHLNIGQPDIETPAVFFDAVKDFKQPVLAYAPSPGVPELVEAVRGYYAKLGIELDSGDILAATGGSEALEMVMTAWFILMPLIALFGGDATLFPANVTVNELLASGPDAVWSKFIRYIGAGAVLAGGIMSLISSLPLIVRTFKDAIGGYGKNGASTLRTEQDLSMYLLSAAWGYGSQELPAPQATLMKMVVEGVMLAEVTGQRISTSPRTAYTTAFTSEFIFIFLKKPFTLFPPNVLQKRT